MSENSETGRLHRDWMRCLGTMSYDFLLTIAIIMLFTKVFGLTSERVHMPQVVGALIAGVLVGPSCLGWVGETDFLVKAAEIGVIILMFNAGMDTDLDELKTTGFASFIIALIGVIVPLIGGVACYLAFDNDPTDPMNMLKAAFIGVVLTATSVSITVETLREMDFANKQLKPDAPKVGGDNIICVSYFGFPEKMDQQAPEALDRIKHELL
mgnify:CR=1 FL=1